MLNQPAAATDDLLTEPLEALEGKIDVLMKELRSRGTLSRFTTHFSVEDGVTESPHEDTDGMDLTADQFFGALPDCHHRSGRWNDFGE